MFLFFTRQELLKATSLGKEYKERKNRELAEHFVKTVFENAYSHAKETGLTYYSTIFPAGSASLLPYVEEVLTRNRQKLLGLSFHLRISNASCNLELSVAWDREYSETEFIVKDNVVVI